MNRSEGPNPSRARFSEFPPPLKAHYAASTQIRGNGGQKYAHVRMRTRKPNFLHVPTVPGLGALATVDVPGLKLAAPFVKRETVAESTDVAHACRRLRKAWTACDAYRRYSVPVTSMKGFKLDAASGHETYHAPCTDKMCSDPFVTECSFELFAELLYIFWMFFVYLLPLDLAVRRRGFGRFLVSLLPLGIAARR